MARIYVDLDDVLAQTGRMFLRTLAAEFGRTVEFESIRSYHLGESLDLDEDELERFLLLTHEPARLLSIEPMPGAALVLEGWIETGHEVVVVTGRPPATLEISREWLRQSGTPFSDLRLLDKYSKFYDGAHGASDGVWELGDLERQRFTLAVEDFPGTALHLAEALSIPVVLFDRPWNREVAESSTAEGIVRCRSWSQIRDRFPLPAAPGGPARRSS